MRHRSSRRGRQYAAIPNSAMRDEALSIEARGMLALLMTYADDWVFNRSHLMKMAGIGRDKFQRIMAELKDAGYVEREAVRVEGGRVSGSTWLINDAPDREPENPAVGSTEGLKNRQPEKPTAGFSGPIRKPRSKNTNIEECVRPQAADDFERFWTVHPRPRDRDATHRAFTQAVAEGQTADVLIAAAEAYRRENAGNRSMYVCYSDNWLRDRRWKEHEPIEPACPTTGSGSVIDLFVKRIRAGQKVYGVSEQQRAELLSSGLVSPEELRRSGVQT